MRGQSHNFCLNLSKAAQASQICVPFKAYAWIKYSFEVWSRQTMISAVMSSKGSTTETIFLCSSSSKLLCFSGGIKYFIWTKWTKFVGQHQYSYEIIRLHHSTFCCEYRRTWASIATILNYACWNNSFLRKNCRNCICRRSNMCCNRSMMIMLKSMSKY